MKQNRFTFKSFVSLFLVLTILFFVSTTLISCSMDDAGTEDETPPEDGGLIVDGVEIKEAFVEIDFNENIYYGINEVRVENPFNTMICNVYIDDTLLENFRGNGLNFSTSIGSSAYNRSLGGPLIIPNSEKIIMGEVASINHNAYRSLNSFLVLDENNYITLRGMFKKCLIGYDHKYVNIESNKMTDEIKVKLSNKTVRLLHYKNVSYFFRLRKAFVSD